MMSYSIPEVENMLDSMVALVDNREQPNKRFRERVEAIGYPHKRATLNFGDYSCEYTNIDGETVSLENHIAIERKMSITELCSCFVGDNRKRFEREFIRFKENGAKAYLIVEDDDLKAIYDGSYRNQKYGSKLHPQALTASLLAWSARYNIKVFFIPHTMSGKLIGDILHYELREYLYDA